MAKSPKIPKNPRKLQPNDLLDKSKLPPGTRDNKGRFLTRPTTAGRKPKQPNIPARHLQQVILRTLNRAGGEDYLLEIAKTDYKTFLALIGRICPTLALEPDEDAAPTNHPPVGFVVHDMEGEFKLRFENVQAQARAISGPGPGEEQDEENELDKDETP